MYLCKNSLKLRLGIQSYSLHITISENNNKKH